MITVSIDETGINQVKCFVTDFTDAMGYCEYKIPFFIQGVKAKKSEAMMIGTQHHEESEKLDRETAITVPLTKTKLENKKEDLNFVREDIQTKFVYDFELPKGDAKLTLFGRADKVFRKKEMLIISDDKNTSRPERHDVMTEPYNDQLLQVLAYLHSEYYLGDSFGGWTKIPHKEKSYQINIIDSKSKTIYKTYEDKVNKTHEKLLFDYTSQFTQKCLDWVSLNHHNSRAKCKACGFFDDCDEALR